MNLSSIKNLLIISVSFIFFEPSISWCEEVNHFQLYFDTRYGVHTYGAPDTATNRQTIEFEQKSEFSNQWSAVLGFRAEGESAYGSVPERYSGKNVTWEDSQLFSFRDNYFQYKDGTFRGRFGFQQIVWGEAFGLYYADIVNPKDFREAGLGSLSRNRLDSPMLNLQWIFANSSFQLLYLVPYKNFNLMPSSGSDFNSFTLPESLPGYRLLIRRDPGKNPTQGEYGARWSRQISGWDISVFYLHYFDRSPLYRYQIDSTMKTFEILPDYKPLQTVGITSTVDLDSFLFRSEVLEHFAHELNTIKDQVLSSQKSDEIIFVLGLDFPEREKWQVGVQYSESHLAKGDWLGRTQKQSVASLRVAKNFSSASVAEISAVRYLEDSSNLYQAQMSWPLTSQVEFQVGADIFEGETTSTLGQFKNANRAWVMLKAFLK